MGPLSYAQKSNISCDLSLYQTSLRRTQHFITDKKLGTLIVTVDLYKNKSKSFGNISLGEVSILAQVNGKPVKMNFALTGRCFDHFKDIGLNIHTIGRTLEIGCGALGLYVKSLRQLGVEAHGVDLVILDKSSDFLVQTSATDLPYPNDFFDTIFSDMSIFVYLDATNDAEREILFHATTEIFRVLKPNGFFKPYGRRPTDEWIKSAFPEFESSEDEKGNFIFKKTK